MHRQGPRGWECAGRSPVDRGKLGMKRSLMVGGAASRPTGCSPPANRHDSPLLAPALDKLEDIGPLPDDITVHLDAGYDSQKARDELAGRGMTGDIAHKGEKARSRPGRAGTSSGPNAWHNNFNRLQRCYERREEVIDAFFDLADAVITVRRLIREACGRLHVLAGEGRSGVVREVLRAGPDDQYHRGADLRQHRLQAHVPRAPT